MASSREKVNVSSKKKKKKKSPMRPGPGKPVSRQRNGVAFRCVRVIARRIGISPCACDRT